MQIESIHPGDLTKGDFAAWHRMLMVQPQFSSPYLTPEWAQAVGQHRGDARVLIFRDGARAVGFLPVQRPDSAAAMPLGSPVCDYQALIGPAGARFDMSAAAEALGVGRIDFTYGLKDSAIGRHLQTSDAGQVANFSKGWDAYCEERKGAGSKVVARARKKLNKLKRDHNGKVEVETFSGDAMAFDQLISWKREQMWRTGVSDIFEHAWINDLVRGIFETPATSSFGGALFVLKVEGRPVAGLFCLQARGALHAWFAAYDSKMAEYSPGLILFVETIRLAAEAGYSEMDLGPGEYPFKKSLANEERQAGAGFAGRTGFHAAYRGAQYQMRALIEKLPVGAARMWPAKAMRRLDMARGLEDPATKSDSKVA